MNRTRIHVEALPMADAMNRATDVLKELKLAPTEARVLTVGRWLKRMHDGGRLSMYRTVAKELGMRIVGDES